jgi:hypothetical protein
LDAVWAAQPLPNAEFLGTARRSAGFRSLPSAGISAHRAARGSKKYGSDGNDYDDAATIGENMRVKVATVVSGKDKPERWMASCRERSAHGCKMVYRLGVT